MRCSIYIIIFFLNLLIITTSRSQNYFSQSSFGTVSGTVSLPDTPNWGGITIIIDGQNKSTITNSAGNFTLSNVTPGYIRIQAGKLFYGNAVKETLLSANQTINLNLALTLAISDTFSGQRTSKLTTAVTNSGNLGVPNRFIEKGDSGFTWFGQQQLKEASLMMGVSTIRVSDAARFIFGLAQDNLDRDFEVRSDIVTQTRGVDSTIQVTAFDDSRANQPPGIPSQPLNLSITQTTSSFNRPGEDAFVIVKLNILSTHHLPLHDLVIGWFVDWDVGGISNTNRGGIITVEQQISGVNNDGSFPIEIAYQRRSTTMGPWMGIVPLSQAMYKAARVASIESEIRPTAPNGGLTEANKYNYMISKRTSNPNSDFGIEENLSTIVSIGGLNGSDYVSSCFVLPARTEIQVGFAFVGGTDSLNLIHNAKQAQIKWVRQGNSMVVYPRSWKVRKGWNMISIPIDTSNVRYLEVFPSTISRPYIYNPNVGYQMQDTVSSGIGYWLKFSSDRVINIDGRLRRIDTLEVVKGWNIIGTLTFPVAVVNITTIPSNLVQSNFFGYDRGYFIADTLIPMQSYWIKANNNGLIILR